MDLLAVLLLLVLPSIFELNKEHSNEGALAVAAGKRRSKWAERRESDGRWSIAPTHYLVACQRPREEVSSPQGLPVALHTYCMHTVSQSLLSVSHAHIYSRALVPSLLLLLLFLLLLLLLLLFQQVF